MNISRLLGTETKITLSRLGRTLKTEWFSSQRQRFKVLMSCSGLVCFSIISAMTASLASAKPLTLEFIPLPESVDKFSSEPSPTSVLDSSGVTIGAISDHGIELTRYLVNYGMLLENITYKLSESEAQALDILLNRFELDHKDKNINLQSYLSGTSLPIISLPESIRITSSHGDEFIRLPAVTAYTVSTFENRVFIKLHHSIFLNNTRVQRGSGSH